jgi:hypothetical protein
VRLKKMATDKEEQYVEIDNEELKDEPKKIGFKDLSTPLKFAYVGGMIYITIWIVMLTVLIGAGFGWLILTITGS